ncbi:GIY-YIG nuclease family protein [Stenotrophomonas rhizophila]|uniref:GIY-YIG nuclease family protein n=1 Tax=Stenotrophomonas rhizophila TaxID=216778 RepID=UPI0015E86361
MNGWIYLLETTSDTLRFKLGRTGGENPLRRYLQLRTGDPGLLFRVAYLVPTVTWKLSRIEYAMHQQFGDQIRFHDDTRSEWFHGRPESAQVLLEGWIGDLFDTQISETFGQGVIWRAHEWDFRNYMKDWPEFA